MKEQAQHSGQYTVTVVNKKRDFRALWTSVSTPQHASTTFHSKFMHASVVGVELDRAVLQRLLPDEQGSADLADC